MSKIFFLKKKNIIIFIIIFLLIFIFLKAEKKFTRLFNNMNKIIENIESLKNDLITVDYTQDFKELDFETYNKLNDNKEFYILFFRHAHREKWIDVHMYDAYELNNKQIAENEFYSDAVCLSKMGKIQAKMMGLVLKELKFKYNTVISSPSCRARQSAELISGYKYDEYEINNLLLHRGAHNEDDNEHAKKVKEFLLSLKDLEQNILIFSHNSVIKGEIFDNFINKPYPYKGLDEGGFYVIQVKDNKLNLIHAYKNFKDFSHYFYIRPLN